MPLQIDAHLRDLRMIHVVDNVDLWIAKPHIPPILQKFGALEAFQVRADGDIPLMQTWSVTPFTATLERGWEKELAHKEMKALSVWLPDASSSPGEAIDPRYFPKLETLRLPNFHSPALERFFRTNVYTITTLDLSLVSADQPSPPTYGLFEVLPNLHTIIFGARTFQFVSAHYFRPPLPRVKRIGISSEAAWINSRSASRSMILEVVERFNSLERIRFMDRTTCQIMRDQGAYRRGSWQGLVTAKGFGWKGMMETCFECDYIAHLCDTSELRNGL